MKKTDKELEKEELTEDTAAEETAEQEKDPEETKVDMNDLIEKSKKGALSQTDLDEAIESMDYDIDGIDKIDKLYEAFEDNGVSLPDGISASEMNEIESEVERFGAGENMERML